MNKRCVYKRAEEGKKFVLTKAGLQVGKVKAKFDENFRNANQYRYTVPQRWIDDGLVQEVNDVEE